MSEFSSKSRQYNSEFSEVKTAVQNEQALVLGGGGSAGNAWLIGIIAGLYEAGVDVTAADLIIGTSAGATTAAQITSVAPPLLLDDILYTPPIQPNVPVRIEGNRGQTKTSINHMERTQRIIDSAEDATDMRCKMGASALEIEGATDNYTQAKWRTTVASRLPSQHWPERPMFITAVNAHNGEPILFNQQSGVELIDAVAASCAGGFAYSIGEIPYIDGGYRADVNADLATGYKRVLIIAPLGDKTRKPLDWGLHLAAQAKELSARGSKVETIFPDSNSQDAIGIGMNLMDLSTRQRSAQAGYNQGKELAKKLDKFWH